MKITKGSSSFALFKSKKRFIFLITLLLLLCCCSCFFITLKVYLDSESEFSLIEPSSTNITTQSSTIRIKLNCLKIDAIKVNNSELKFAEKNDLCNQGLEKTLANGDNNFLIVPKINGIYEESKSINISVIREEAVEISPEVTTNYNSIYEIKDNNKYLTDAGWNIIIDKYKNNDCFLYDKCNLEEENQKLSVKYNVSLEDTKSLSGLIPSDVILESQYLEIYSFANNLYNQKVEEVNNKDKECKNNAMYKKIGTLEECNKAWQDAIKPLEDLVEAETIRKFNVTSEKYRLIYIHMESVVSKEFKSEFEKLSEQQKKSEDNIYPIRERIAKKYNLLYPKTIP